MKKLLFLFALGLLVFCAGCGTNGIGGLIGTGHFSNGSLNGPYVYQITGWDFGSGLAVPYSEAGIFTADGSGHITSATDDFVEEGNGGVSTNTATGTYGVGTDGRGVLTLNFTGGGSITLDISLVSSSKLYLIEEDNANSTGVAEKQASTTLPATATAYVFTQHSVSAVQDFDSVGQFTLATDLSLTGSDDINRNGVINNGGGTASPLALAGGSLFTAPGSGGRPAGSGTATLVDSTGTTDFIYYVVDANNIRFITSDSDVVGLGRAEAQTGQPFSSDPLSGKSYAFGSRANDSPGGPGAVNSVGSLSANAGALTGTLDTVLDGTSYANIAISSGAYTTVSASGRSVVTTTTAVPSTVAQVFWMVNPSRAFFLTTSDSSDPSKIEDGTADQQQGTFSNSSLNGQYAFFMDGYDLNVQGGQGAYIDRIGWIQWNGSGSLTWNEDINSSGFLTSPGPLSGTYTVGGNGRATATVNNLSYANGDIVFYLVSGSNAYILENDPGVQINGAMNLQSQ